MKYPSLFFLIITFVGVSVRCIAQTGDFRSENYYFQKSCTNTVKGWIALLPGANGLTVFGDTTHYFSVAEKLNKVGYNTLLIDYKPAYKRSGRKVKESTSDKILWVFTDAIYWAKKEGLIAGEGGIIGWSLAGEGILPIINNNQLSKELDISYAALYYPSNKLLLQSKASIPTLVQSGREDNVTDTKQIIQTYDQCGQCEVVLYEGAHHGFDIESLGSGRSLRFPPLFGKKYVFRYNQEVAQLASDKLFEFINSYSK